MNRRELLKLGTMAAMAVKPDGATATRAIQDRKQTVGRWDIHEVTLAGRAEGNPFVEVALQATFSLGHRSLQVDGFYDGDGSYKIRFTPDTVGEWSYTTRSNAAELDGKTGTLICAEALPGVNGPVRVRDTSHFAYEDGTPYFPFGTTCYAWTHQSEAMQRQTLQTLAAAPFNKLRMCVFPKHYEYNHNEPPLYPFQRDASGKHDFSRFNPAYFAHLEKQILQLQKLGIEADLILFHPYDRWGYAAMTGEQDDRYLKYVLARISACRNVWWSVANEYDLMKAKSTTDFDRFFRIIQELDPYSHLRSIHYARTLYDYAKPWVTHICMQSSSFEQGPEMREALLKPMIWDEVGYEGNLNRRWGNLSGPEMARRFWMGIVAGGYVSHGETLLKESDAFDEESTPELWWSHGGRLRGASATRIGFLRKLVEETAETAAAASTPGGLVPQSKAYYLNASTTDQSGRTRQILYYLDAHQPLYYEFPLPEGEFTAELIDPWEMKVTRLEGIFKGKSKIRLRGIPYQAVRFRRLPVPPVEPGA